MNWIKDDCGDLINLTQMECVIIAPIEEEDSRPNPSDTHEILAVNPKGESYRLDIGSEMVMQKTLRELENFLNSRGNSPVFGK